MKEQSIIEVGKSRPAWEVLEAYAREGIRHLLQHLLEEEMEEVLGRRRYEWRDGVDPPAGYRSGFGKPRRLSLMSGTITVRRPRVRGQEARFESRLLPLFKRRTEEVGWLLPELYLHGLEKAEVSNRAWTTPLTSHPRPVSAIISAPGSSYCRER